MVCGLVLAFLEGRRQTEALSAALCASFVVFSGAVKSVGRWLFVQVGLDEHRMRMVVGLVFVGPLLACVALLAHTPPAASDCT